MINLLDTKNPDPVTLSDTVFTDLEFFEGSKYDPGNTLFKHLDKTHTKLSQIQLKHILNTPTTDAELLKSRQNIITALNNSPELTSELIKHYKSINETEDEMNWFFDNNDELKEMLNVVYFSNRFLKFLNHDERVLKWTNFLHIIFYPIYAIISPMLFTFLSYLIAKYMCGLKINFWEYCKFTLYSMLNSAQILSLLFNIKPVIMHVMKYAYLIFIAATFLYGIYIAITSSMTINGIINKIHSRTNNISKYVRNAYDIYEKSKHIFSLPHEPIDITPFSDLWNETFQCDPCLTSNKGIILKTFYEFQENKEKLIPLIRYITDLDVYLNSQILLAEGYTLTTFSDTLEISEMFNPCILNDQITNSITLTKGTGLVITGPNAAGKSTFIKTLIINIILSQSLGICAAKNMTIYPFDYIGTYLNIPDTMGKESLFQTEMKQLLENINTIEKFNKDGKKTILIMDEMFSSTNYMEGVAGAYAIAKRLKTFENNITILTTHYNYLTKLETEGYINYYFNGFYDEINNKMIYDYKIKTGKNENNIAIELLQLNGFDNELVNDAKIIFNELSNNEDKEESLDES